MSTLKISCCSLILKHHFGEVVAQIGEYLMKQGGTPLPFIIRDTGVTLNKIRSALATLTQHNICTSHKNTRNLDEYVVNLDHILLRNRFPQFIYSAKTLYGDAAELIVEEVLNQGRVQMSKTCHRVTQRLAEAATADESGATKKLTIFQIRDKFKELVQTRFVQRCPTVGESEDNQEEDLYAIPNVDFSSGRKRKRSQDGAGNASKRIKLDETKESEDTGQAPEDEDIVWRVNVERFHQYLRDQAIVAAVSRKIDKRTSDVVRTILRVSEVCTQVRAPYTNPVSYHEIFNALPPELNMNKQVLDQTLKIAAEDSMQFLQRVGDSGGGMFSINFQKALTALATAHVESVIQERFGSKSLRIFRLLLMKRQLEQKRVEECVMIPAKEVKDLLYKMFAENFLHLTEIAKTPDHAPSRTFYLFSVNIKQVSQMLLERTYKTLYNMIRRRECETKKQKRLLDKKQRVEAIIASLEGADPNQIKELEETLTPTENAAIEKVKHIINKLEMSEIQVDEALMMFAMYLDYSVLK